MTTTDLDDEFPDLDIRCNQKYAHAFNT